MTTRALPQRVLLISPSMVPSPWVCSSSTHIHTRICVCRTVVAAAVGSRLCQPHFSFLGPSSCPHPSSGILTACDRTVRNECIGPCCPCPHHIKASGSESSSSNGSPSSSLQWDFARLVSMGVGPWCSTFLTSRIMAHAHTHLVDDVPLDITVQNDAGYLPEISAQIRWNKSPQATGHRDLRLPGRSPGHVPPRRLPTFPCEREPPNTTSNT